jgi:hypothetical protein
VIATLAHSLVTHAPALNAAARIVLAAATDPTTDDDTDSESKKSGPIGLVVIIVLCVACYFLFKSLSRHLRRVREGSFEQTGFPTASSGTSARAGSGSGSGSGAGTGSGSAGPSDARAGALVDDPAGVAEPPAAPPS